MKASCRITCEQLSCSSCSCTDGSPLNLLSVSHYWTVCRPEASIHFEQPVVNSGCLIRPVCSSHCRFCCTHVGFNAVNLPPVSAPEPRSSGAAAAGLRGSAPGVMIGDVPVGLTWSSGRLVISLTGCSRLEPVQAADRLSSAAMAPCLRPCLLLLCPAAAAQRRRRRLRDPPAVCLSVSS